MEVPLPVTGLQLVTGEVLDIHQEPARLPTNRIHSVDEAGPYTANLTILPSFGAVLMLASTTLEPLAIELQRLLGTTGDRLNARGS